MNYGYFMRCLDDRDYNTVCSIQTFNAHVNYNNK